MILLINGIINAENSIIDTSKILRENVVFVVDARKDFMYALEIKPNGKVVKIPLTQKQSEALKRELDIKITKDSTSTIYENKPKQCKQWDKRKIIYEQKVEVLKIK